MGRAWLILSLVKRAFGGHPHTPLLPIGQILRKQKGTFPLDEIEDKFRGTTKSLQVTEDDIENLVLSRYGQGCTFSTLSLLYPTLDYRNNSTLTTSSLASLFTRS